MIPSTITNALVLMKTCAKLSDDEVAELVNQIEYCLNEKKMKHFVIGVRGIYWEINWLKRARVYDVITSFNGRTKEEMLKLVPDTSIWYENLE